MGLFIDTSNRKFIIGLIVNGVVTHFEKRDTDNRVAKHANVWIRDFLNKAGVKLEDIEDFYFTKGPGSFTGVKVAYNFVKTVAMVDNIKHVYTIDTLNLIYKPGYNNAALSFGKGKYYVRKFHKLMYKEKSPILFSMSLGTRFFVASELKEEKNWKNFTFNKTIVDYDQFEKEDLEGKLKYFKKERLDSVNLVFQKVSYK